MFNFSKFFLGEWILKNFLEKCWYFWKMDSFSNTLNRFKILNFIPSEGAAAPLTPCWGRVIAFWWPDSPPPNQNPPYATAFPTPKMIECKKVEAKLSCLESLYKYSCLVSILKIPGNLNSLLIYCPYLQKISTTFLRLMKKIICYYLFFPSNIWLSIA